jgi:ankyrin repeat protein
MGWNTLFIVLACGASVVSLAGADGRVADSDGTTPLHWAVRHDDLKTTDALIKAGADVHADTRYENTPNAQADTY